MLPVFLNCQSILKFYYSVKLLSSSMNLKNSYTALVSDFLIEIRRMEENICKQFSKYCTTTLKFSSPCSVRSSISISDMLTNSSINIFKW